MRCEGKATSIFCSKWKLLEAGHDDILRPVVHASAAPPSACDRTRVGRVRYGAGKKMNRVGGAGVGKQRKRAGPGAGASGQAARWVGKVRASSGYGASEREWRARLGARLGERLTGRLAGWLD